MQIVEVKYDANPHSIKVLRVGEGMRDGSGVQHQPVVKDIVREGCGVCVRFEDGSDMYLPERVIRYIKRDRRPA